MSATETLVEGFALGPYATNCYIVRLPGASECWIIDAGFTPAPLVEAVQAHGLTPTRIILTHAHVDHIAGLSEVRATFPGVPVAIHAQEQEWLNDPVRNLSAAFGQPITSAPAEELLEGGETLDLNGVPFHVLHTPGHSPGGITLHQPDAAIAIVGDTLFAESVGRTDFPTSDPQQLVTSIRKSLYTLPDDTAVLPGHGPATTIGHEKRCNPFVQSD
ncbi:MAG: MBL fold metallo-hydrolase [Planctomycetota bacterium]